MNHAVNPTAITHALLEFGKSIPAADLFPTLVPEAGELATRDPYAFSIATCLDRGTKADVIWTIPYDIQTYLGHLNPNKIYMMSLEDLAGLFKRLPRKPRYIHDAPRTLSDLTRIVVEEFNGDAANLWKGRRAAEVNRILRSIHGVGPGIANMGVLLIEKAYGVRFSDLDRTRMDIKPDVHTVRVLYRLGMSEFETGKAAIAATRQMNPAFPGELDGALWEIGRRWCSPSAPDCAGCPVGTACAKRIA